MVLFLPSIASSSAFDIASTFFAIYIVYLVSVSIHRLYFSQYAKFPGPRLAALTYGYMFYYDAIAGKGQYIYKIKELHEQYSKPQSLNSPRQILNHFQTRKSNNPNFPARAPRNRSRLLRRPLCRSPHQARQTTNLVPRVHEH